MRGFLVCVLIALFSFGCARTVTDQKQILWFDLTATFKANIDVTTMRYYLVFSTSSSPIALPNPASALEAIYFPTPGEPYDTGYEGDDPIFKQEVIDQNNDISYYYDTYYSSWSDYMVLHPTEYALYRSVSFFDATTSDNLTYAPSRGFSADIAVSGKTLNVVFNTEFLGLSPGASTRLYFTLFTTEITEASDLNTGHFRDKLANQESLILQAREEITLKSDVDNFTLRAESKSADIDTLEVRLY